MASAPGTIASGPVSGADFPSQADGTMASYDHGPSLLAAAWVFLGLSAIALGLRLFCKLSTGRRLWWDDGILIASWVAFALDAALTTYLVELGLGKPPQTLIGNMDKFVVAVLVRGTFAITSIAWSKTGFAVTMLRLTEGWVKRFMWFIIITVNLSLGISALLQWVQCTPIHANWDPSVLEKSCAPKTVILGYNLFSGAWSAAADVILALLPWQVLSQLQMNKREKIGAGIAMSMGIIAGIVAIVKTAHLDKIYGDDQSEGHVLMLWDLAETGVTIIAASIPALRVLFRHVRRGTRMGSSGADRYAMPNLKRTNVVKPTCLESQNDDAFDDANDTPPAADARSDKGILEMRVLSVESHPADENAVGRKEAWQ